MNIQTSLDIFHVVSAEIVRETSSNFAWYRIHLHGEDPNDVCTITVFPSTYPNPAVVPPAEEFFKFSPTKDTMAPLVASPASATPSTSESNSEL